MSKDLPNRKRGSSESRAIAASRHDPLTAGKTLHAMVSRNAPVRSDRTVPRSIGLAHIIRQDDGTSVGVWGILR